MNSSSFNVIKEPADPQGDGDQEVFMRNLKRWIRAYIVLNIKGARRVPQPNCGVIYEIADAKPADGSGGGFRWQEPKKELDPTVAVAKDTWVYISPNNDLVLTGLTDLVSGINQKACEGTWIAAKAVPAKNGGGQYNVPTFPYPGATGTPSGSPLAGDLDGADVFWIYRGQLACAT